jgi:hypothetical protein
MFWEIPGYYERIERMLTMLVDGEIAMKIQYSDQVDINLLGAALAALLFRDPK